MEKAVTTLRYFIVQAYFLDGQCVETDQNHILMGDEMGFIDSRYHNNLYLVI